MKITVITTYSKAFEGAPLGFDLDEIEEGVSIWIDEKKVPNPNNHELTDKIQSLCSSSVVWIGQIQFTSFGCQNFDMVDFTFQAGTEDYSDRLCKRKLTRLYQQNLLANPRSCSSILYLERKEVFHFEVSKKITLLTKRFFAYKGIFHKQILREQSWEVEGNARDLYLPFEEGTFEVTLEKKRERFFICFSDKPPEEITREKKRFFSAIFREIGGPEESYLITQLTTERFFESM